VCPRKFRRVSCLALIFVLVGVSLVFPTSTWAFGPGTDLANADASFIGEREGAFSGYSVALAGDVNGDGYDDFLIGAYGDDEGGSDFGQTYLILGKDHTDWGNDFDLADADASFIGEAWGWSGYSAASAGDVNGDGYDDFLIGAPMLMDPFFSWAGKTYLILGKDPADWGKGFDLTNADASFISEDWCWSGWSVASAGDVNGDGYDDFLIGAPVNDDGGDAAGKTYLILGKANGWVKNFNLANADASFIGEREDAFSGRSVASAGDVNRDSYDDFLIGAPDKEDGSYAGQTYLILGKDPADWGKGFDLANADASFIGEREDAFSGWSVASAGDVNRDGSDDFLIGAYGDEEGGADAGQTYLILGKDPADWGKGFDLANADASFIGEDVDDWSGNSVASAGDVNGDGYDDFLIGAYGNEGGGADAGQTYLILGKYTGWAMDTDLWRAHASFIGEDADDLSGASVASAGDVNGDGYDDFLIGAYGNEEGGSSAGQTYLLLGSKTPPVVGVGGEVYYVNKGNVLAPWLALAAAIIAGGIILRRRISQG